MDATLTPERTTPRQPSPSRTSQGLTSAEAERRLAAIEEMAGVDVLCSDKTGTITQNRLTVAQIRPMGGASEEDVLLFGLLASREENGDPIDTAILEASRERPAVGVAADRFTVTDFVPFDPVSKRTEAVVEDERGGRIRAIKGAPQVVLEASTDRDLVEEAVLRQVDDLADQGYRALGVARESAEGHVSFLGLLGLFDPPRTDSAETVRRARELGVEVKMVTGDHTAIAEQVSEQVGLGSTIREPSAFLTRSDREAERVVEEAEGFAQVFPEHKYHIVELLQRRGHIVGMTGDGVNDAPALKKADAGIAVEGLRLPPPGSQRHTVQPMMPAGGGTSVPFIKENDDVQLIA